MTDAARPAVPIVSPDVRASVRLAGLLALSWLVLLGVSFLMLRQPSALAAGNPVSGGRAAFTAANVGAMNGFVLDFAHPGDFSNGVQAVFVLQTLSCLLMTLIGGGVLWARVLGRPYTDAQITRTAISLIVVAAALSPVLIKATGGAGSAIVAALCALGNGGVLFGGPPRPGPAFSLALVPMSLLGSLGVVVVRDIAETLFRGGKLPDHARRVLTLTAGVYVAGVGLLMTAEHVAGKEWRPELARFDSLVWMARAWGEPVEFAHRFSNGVFTILSAIAAVGVGTAGTAGAIGLGWLVTVPPRLRAMILNGLTAQAVIAAGTLVAIARFEPSLDAGRRAVLAVSAVMNLGLSHDALSITGPSLFAMTIAMIAAKLAPLVLFAHVLLRPTPETAGGVGP